LAVGLGDQGVIDMALLSVIRRWHLREGMPIREIERRTGLSRNTIRKYLRTGVVEPTFKVRDPRASLTRLPRSCRAGCGWKLAGPGSSGARSSCESGPLPTADFVNAVNNLDGYAV